MQISSHTISVISLIVSFIALFLTYLRSVYRVKFLCRGKDIGIDYFSIINKSQFAVNVAALGHINTEGKVTWLDGCAERVKNIGVDLPIEIQSGAAFEGHRTYNGLPDRGEGEHGYCIQLANGATYAYCNNLPIKTRAMIFIKALISRWTFGNFGFRNSFND